MNLKLGSHVSMSGKSMLLGSAKEAESYGANTFMFYTGAPQNTKRKEISEELIKEYSEIFKNVLSEKFELKAQLIKLQEKNYFSIEIPVFWEKYQKELNVGKGL